MSSVYDEGVPVTPEEAMSQMQSQEIRAHAQALAEQMHMQVQALKTSSTARERAVQLTNLPKQAEEHRYGRIVISNELLAAILPKGTKVVRVLPPDPHMSPDSFNVVVEHPHFPPAEEGVILPLSNVVVHSDEFGFITNSEFIGL